MKHRKQQNEWKLGEMTIDECTSYKYLGDIISNDGKNTKNIEKGENQCINRNNKHYCRKRHPL